MLPQSLNYGPSPPKNPSTILSLFGEAEGAGS